MTCFTLIPVNKIFGVIIDKDVKFDNHIKQICRKAGNKLSALARMTTALSPFQKITLCKSFIKELSQFNHGPLLWMFCSRSSNKMINKIHERALRFTSEINDIPFSELLIIYNEITVHHTFIKMPMASCIQ